MRHMAFFCFRYLVRSSVPFVCSCTALDLFFLPSLPMFWHIFIPRSSFHALYLISFLLLFTPWLWHVPMPLSFVHALCLAYFSFSSLPTHWHASMPFSLAFFFTVLKLHERDNGNVSVVSFHAATSKLVHHCYRHGVSCVQPAGRILVISRIMAQGRSTMEVR